MRILFLSVVASFGLALSTVSFAINNIENERLGTVDEGISGQFQASIDGKSGNSDNESFNLGIKAIYKSGHHMLLSIANREYGKSLNQTNTDNDFIHFRYVREVNSLVSGELFAQNQSDSFKRLTERSLLGLGARFDMVNGATQKLIAGTGVFYAFERIGNEAREQFWRGNIYLVYKTELNNQVNLLNTLYIQPKLDKASDIEALNDLSLNVKLTGTLKLQLSLKTTHDREPPADVKKTDNAYSTSLIYSF